LAPGDSDRPKESYRKRADVRGNLSPGIFGGGLRKLVCAAKGKWRIGLHGTKYGCGIAQCGACTVHIEGQATRSCVTPLSAVAGQHVTTIEGITSKAAKAVQTAWIDLQVPQCGYCQSGQIMAVAAYLKDNPNPTDADIDMNLTNICRCGTYERLRRGVHRAAALMKT
jgi:isoquinoline 1-oxidoreductase alpha subunit